MFDTFFVRSVYNRLFWRRAARRCRRHGAGAADAGGDGDGLVVGLAAVHEAGGPDGPGPLVHELPAGLHRGSRGQLPAADGARAAVDARALSRGARDRPGRSAARAASSSAAASASRLL